MTTAVKHLPETADPRDRVEFRLYFAIAFAIFLPVALFSRLLPRSLRPFGRSASRVSVFEEARTAARNVAPWIFMG
ncbi:MAG: cytochrome PufQ [Parvularculaceae bacterium]|nr:cytochrome PufQ [Parvularculaceae bacterium]